MKRLLLITLLAVVSTRLEAAAPVETARQFFHELVNCSQIETLDERQAKVSALILEHFDFPSFYEKALSDHWQTWNPLQKEQFHQVFHRRFIEHIAGHATRLKRLHETKVTYRVVEGRRDRKVVEASSLHKGEKIVVHLYLAPDRSGWRVYDLDISGAKLSRNYRGQFNYVLRKSGFSGLLAKLG